MQDQPESNLLDEASIDQRTWRSSLIAGLLGISIVILSIAWAVSDHHCISYARGPFFMVISDGFIVLPFPDGKPRTWLDWGWWVQEPWRDRFSEVLVELVPTIGITRQINASGIHLPIPTLLLILSFIMVYGRIASLEFEHLRILRRISATALLTLLFLPVIFNWPVLDDVKAIKLIIGVVWVACCLVSLLRTRKYPPGHCQECGYNLRGNISGRCPECGTSCDTTTDATT